MSSTAMRDYIDVTGSTGVEIPNDERCYRRHRSIAATEAAAKKVFSYEFLVGGVALILLLACFHEIAAGGRNDEYYWSE